MSAESLEPTPVLLLKLKPDYVRTTYPAGVSASQLPWLIRDLSLPEGCRLEEPVINRLFASSSGSEAPESTRVNFDRFLYLHLPGGMASEEVLTRLRQHPWTEYIEVDAVLANPMMEKPSLSALGVNSSNTYWHLERIMVPQLWEITHGSSNVLVAILSTGLNVHPSIESRLVPGYNFVNRSTNTTDNHRGGSIITYLMAADGDNPVCGVGVDWRCRIMPVKTADQAAGTSASLTAQGIDFAVSNGCKVIYSSFMETNLALTLAVSNAVQKGVIVVTTTASEYGSPKLEGNRQPINVAACSQEEYRTTFGLVDIYAPGSRVPAFEYDGSNQPVRISASGSGVAMALVAGTCSLLASIKPDLTQEQARQLLCYSADLEAMGGTNSPEVDPTYGWGRLNAYYAWQLMNIRFGQPWAGLHSIELTCSSPPTVRHKAPYQMEITSDLQHWELSEYGYFHYETNQASWRIWRLEDPTLPQFYRLSLKPLKRPG